MSASRQIAVPSFTENRCFVNWSESPSSRRYLEKAYLESIEPIYGSQANFLRKIYLGIDRECEILLEDGKRVGVLVYKTHLTEELANFDIHRTFEIKSLFLTDPQKNSGRGLGTCLLDRAVTKALDLGAHSIEVTVNSSKPESLKFFIKNNFYVCRSEKYDDTIEHILCRNKLQMLI